ncbi:uncharacterized protein [Amphiura filiformis]|uniref:uncharacterized protein n=1 Tax=Amphiura filiformis TaxID=82378 RepID=UPI003B223686
MERPFIIPKKDLASSVEGNRHPVESMRERSDLHDIVKQSCLNHRVIPRFWKERTITTVHQPEWAGKFHGKRRELRSTSSWESSVVPYPVGYAFGLVRKDSLADVVCSTLSFKNHEFCDMPLGDVDKGVNLFLHADLLLEWARKQRYRNPSLVIYKIIKGRCKILPRHSMADGQLYEPTLNYECHVLKQRYPAKDDLLGHIRQSQIFLYEYGEGCVPMKSPRHYVPYAVICFERDESVPSRQETNSATTPKMWLPWLQSVHSNPRLGIRSEDCSCREHSASASNYNLNTNRSVSNVERISGSNVEHVSNVERVSGSNVKRVRRDLELSDNDSNSELDINPCVHNVTHETNSVSSLKRVKRTTPNVFDDSTYEDENGISNAPDDSYDEDSDDENGPSDFIDVGDLSDDECEGDDADTIGAPDISGHGYCSFTRQNQLDPEEACNNDEETNEHGKSPVSNGYHSNNSPTYESFSENESACIYNSDTTSCSDLTPSEEESDSEEEFDSEDESDCPRSIKVIPNISTNPPNVQSTRSYKIGLQIPSPQTKYANSAKLTNMFSPAQESLKRRKNMSAPAPKSVKRRHLAETRRNQMNEAESDDEEDTMRLQNTSVRRNPPKSCNQSDIKRQNTSARKKSSGLRQYVGSPKSSKQSSDRELQETSVFIKCPQSNNQSSDPSLQNDSKRRKMSEARDHYNYVCLGTTQEVTRVKDHRKAEASKMLKQTLLNAFALEALKTAISQDNCMTLTNSHKRGRKRPSNIENENAKSEKARKQSSHEFVYSTCSKREKVNDLAEAGNDADGGMDEGPISDDLNTMEVPISHVPVKGDTISSSCADDGKQFDTEITHAHDAIYTPRRVSGSSNTAESLPQLIRSDKSTLASGMKENGKTQSLIKMTPLNGTTSGNPKVSSDSSTATVTVSKTTSVRSKDVKVVSKMKEDGKKRSLIKKTPLKGTISGNPKVSSESSTATVTVSKTTSVRSKDVKSVSRMKEDGKKQTIFKNTPLKGTTSGNLKVSSKSSKAKVTVSKITSVRSKDVKSVSRMKEGKKQTIIEKTPLKGTTSGNPKVSSDSSKATVTVSKITSVRSKDVKSVSRMKEGKKQTIIEKTPLKGTTSGNPKVSSDSSKATVTVSKTTPVRSKDVKSVSRMKEDEKKQTIIKMTPLKGTTSGNPKVSSESSKANATVCKTMSITSKDVSDPKKIPLKDTYRRSKVKRVSKSAKAGATNLSKGLSRSATPGTKEGNGEIPPKCATSYPQKISGSGNEVSNGLSKPAEGAEKVHGMEEKIPLKSLKYTTASRFCNALRSKECPQSAISSARSEEVKVQTSREKAKKSIGKPTARIAPTFVTGMRVSNDSMSSNATASMRLQKSTSPSARSEKDKLPRSKENGTISSDKPTYRTPLTSSTETEEVSCIEATNNGLPKTDMTEEDHLEQGEKSSDKPPKRTSFTSLKDKEIPSSGNAVVSKLPRPLAKSDEVKVSRSNKNGKKSFGKSRERISRNGPSNNSGVHAVYNGSPESVRSEGVKKVRSLMDIVIRPKREDNEQLHYGQHHREQRTTGNFMDAWQHNIDIIRDHDCRLPWLPERWMQRFVDEEVAGYINGGRHGEWRNEQEEIAGYINGRRHGEWRNEQEEIAGYINDRRHGEWRTEQVCWERCSKDDIHMSDDMGHSSRITNNEHINRRRNKRGRNRGRGNKRNLLSYKTDDLGSSQQKSYSHAW